MDTSIEVARTCGCCRLTGQQRSPGSQPALDSGRRRRSEPARYERLIAEAAAQLAAGLSRSTWESVIVMPVVGFGDQHREVLDSSLRLLDTAVTGGRRLLVAVVNRPQHEPEDGAARVLEELAPALDRIDVVVCRLALERRTRVGELRQLAVDALERVIGELPAHTPVLVCDDDVAAMPRSALSALEGAVGRGAGLAVGPVLFDDPRRPMCLFGDLFAADVVRALLGRRLLQQWQRPDPADGSDLAVLESLVFSGGLAVSREALASAGGFRDLNEITWLARDVLTAPELAQRVRLVDPVTSVTDPTAHLLTHAARMSSRRALAAWREHGLPTVAQWRGFRFTASRVDPARRPAPLAGIPAPARDLPASGRALLVESFGAAVAVTCRYLRPEPGLVQETLVELGLSRGDVAVRLEASDDWRVSVRRPGGFLEWLVQTQQDELGRWEAATFRPTSAGVLESGQA